MIPVGGLVGMMVVTATGLVVVVVVVLGVTGTRLDTMSMVTAAMAAGVVGLGVVVVIVVDDFVMMMVDVIHVGIFMLDGAHGRR